MVRQEGKRGGLAGKTPYFPRNRINKSYDSAADSGDYSGMVLYAEWLHELSAVPAGAASARLCVFDGPVRGARAVRRCASPYYCRIEYPGDGWQETRLGYFLGRWMDKLFSEHGKELYIRGEWKNAKGQQRTP